MKDAILAQIEAQGSDCPILVDMSKVAAIYVNIDEEEESEFILRVVVDGKLLSIPMNTKAEVLTKKERLIKIWKKCFPNGFVTTYDV